ncbi:cation:proton antiporter [Microbacterium suaedae]|uniref:cation:proton antiporter n=1 Tax=Microbacterium suaedae TaxID=2067813 RepID=UPI000DA143D3|nr:sodium:proton antiporter [Microbacterium suaedae]
MQAEFFSVLAGAVIVAGIARWRGWPAPLLVTAVALIASLLPFVPEVEIDGELLLALALPPLLYSAALDASFVSFRRSMPHVRRLGVGLVAVTALVVGVVAWLIMPDLTFAGALLLGAIVGPPDAVSAAAIGRRLGLPRRVMTVISGESLINDATSLTLVRVFAAIVAGATVTVWQGIGEFALAVVVGVGVGLVAGVVLHALRMRFDDPVVTGTVGLLLPFGVYAGAEQLYGSGVLAVVAMGLFVGSRAPLTSYTQRQQEKPIWRSVDFLLEAFVFAYIGLQLPTVLDAVFQSNGLRTILLAFAVFAVVLVVRPIFVFLSYRWGRGWQWLRVKRWKHAVEAFQRDPQSSRARAVRIARKKSAADDENAVASAMRKRTPEPLLSWQERAVISWAGMRGVVTLAMAAALPDITNHSMPEGHVEVLVAVAFVVTVGTLLLQGLTLPALIRRLHVSNDDEKDADARALERVRDESRKAGIEYLRSRQGQWEQAHGTEGSEMLKAFSRRLLRVERDTDREAVGAEREAALRRDVADEIAELTRGWLAVRRSVLLEEFRLGHVSEEVMRDLFDAMDAEELALDYRGAHQAE